MDERFRKDMIYTKDYMSCVEVDRYAAYGNFLDRFRECNDHGRRVLIQERPENDHLYPIDVAILAAAVEALVKEYGMEMPEWVMDPKYILEEPYYGNAILPESKAFLKETALPEFAKRNLYLGDNCMDRA